MSLLLRQDMGVCSIPMSWLTDLTMKELVWKRSEERGKNVRNFMEHQFAVSDFLWQCDGVELVPRK
jgi:hypothetical protein